LIFDLVDVLRSKGILTTEELPAATEAIAEAEERAAVPDVVDEAPNVPLRWPGIAIRVDPEDPEFPEPVDCAARMAVCKAVCCKLKFPLTSEEVEAGIAKWDIGHPYVIRQDSTGYCCHNDASTGGCTIYNDRPNLCRRYSCRYDTRIWTDFENMILNQEWIDSHVGRSDAILIEPEQSIDNRQSDPSFV